MTSYLSDKSNLSNEYNYDYSAKIISARRKIFVDDEIIDDDIDDCETNIGKNNVVVENDDVYDNFSDGEIMMILILE